MERGKTTDFILKQFKKKSKRIVNKDFFTEFFYLNKERQVIEFLRNGNGLVMESFFKEFLPEEFKEFVKVKLYNDVEEEINTWYYDEENLVVILDINWGFKKQQVSIDLDIENFAVTVIDENGGFMKRVDYVLFNDYLISFLTTQARTLAQSFETLNKKSNTGIAQ